jgi:hypothetical protein
MTQEIFREIHFGFQLHPLAIKVPVLFEQEGGEN